MLKIKTKEQKLSLEERLEQALIRASNAEDDLTKTREDLALAKAENSNLKVINNSLERYKKEYCKIRKIPSIFHETERYLRGENIETLAFGLETIKLRYHMIKHIIDSKISKIADNMMGVPKY